VTHFAIPLASYSAILRTPVIARRGFTVCQIDEVLAIGASYRKHRVRGRPHSHINYNVNGEPFNAAESYLL
jgi:hypothetical protein